MVVDPNFGHSGIEESLLTQVHRKPRLITVSVLGGQNGRGVCPMTPRGHGFHSNVTLLISLMKGGRWTDGDGNVLTSIREFVTD